MHKRYKKLFTDTALFAISNFGSKILTFLLVPLYTSILNTDEYGVIDILTTTVNLLYPILTLSIYDATLRFALDKKYDKKAVLSTSIIITIVAMIVLMIFTPFIYGGDNLFGQYWLFLVGIFFTTSLQMCLSNYIKGCEKTKIYAIQGIIYTLTFLGFNILFLVIIKIGLHGYLFSIILAGMISCIYMIISSNCIKDIVPLHIDRGICKEMLAFSIPMIPTSIAWWINSSADKYMILGIVGVSANGLYGVAHKIPTIFTSFSYLFSQAWRISAISSYNDSDKKTYYSKVYKTYSLICIYACVFLTHASQFVAKIIFKADYYQAWIFVPPLVIAALFEAYAGFLASIYAAAKKTQFLSVSTGVGAFVNVSLNYLLINYLGTIGAAIATMISFIVVWSMRLIVMRKFMPININYLKSILSLMLNIFSGMYFAFQGRFRYIIGLIVISMIFFINYHETIQIIGTICKVIKNKMNNESIK